ncbi:hypothetical protein KSP39_PZI001276 [Platanthera zijinensis]|uniref:MULE transposase domain-containing protein n=1 Tax=Platanthera zijinensis TaxID=2320716 RepID=A0AAP0C1U6_9ASPA
MKWQPGIIFRSKEEFKDAVTTYAVHTGVGLKLTKNDKSRVRFKCKEGCNWEIYAAPVKNQDTWEVRTIIDKHTCSREFNNRLLSAKWLGKRIESKVRENPNIQLKQIVAKTKEKWVVGISKDKACRAKMHANTLLEGSVGEQYNMLNLYCAEILKSNPDSESLTPSRVIVPCFQRLYMCFTSCRESFKVCRPIIGLDGCFLKGQYGGQLLTAIGRDPNDQMLPIAYAVVEVENKDSWSWFLSCLARDINHPNITYISDQQKVRLNFFI